MKSFKIWLEAREEDVQDTLLSLLGLTRDDLETPLKLLDPSEILSQLRPLGLWNTLPSYIQDALTTIIKDKIGNVRELIEKILDFANSKETTSGIRPPIR